MKYFASDNNSGAHPRILEALAAANAGFASSYGEDEYTHKAVETIRGHFGEQARPWFVFLGTAANVLGLKCMVRPHEAVLCSDMAHIHTDECGAPEAVAGCKLIPLPSRHGKIRLEDCRRALKQREAVHHNYPKVLSITQSTECGTLYTVEELREISAFCRKHDLYFHMDGARLGNAAAAMEAPLRALCTDVGVDVLSFGGTKNGLMFGEVVIFLNAALGHDFPYVRKQNMQLISKMRFMAAQFLEYLSTDLWLENARHANRMTALLAAELKGIEEVRVEYPVQVNAIFARLPKKIVAQLHKDFYFYILDESAARDGVDASCLVRLMTSFNTTEKQVRDFAAAIRTCARKG